MSKIWLGLLAVATLEAGNVKIWSADEFASANVLAVVRVESVTQGPPRPGFKPQVQYDVRTCNARLRVLRSFPALKTAVANLSYSCNGTLGLGANMPLYPGLASGKAYLLPLASAAEKWTLIGDQGIRLIIPVLAAAPLRTVKTRREFLASEITNLMLHASFHEAYLAGHELALDRSPTFVDELMAQFAAVLLPDSPQWLELATALLADPYFRPVEMRDLVSQSSVTVQTGLALRVLRHVSEQDRRRLIALNAVSRAYLLGSSSERVLSPSMQEELLGFLPGDLAEPRPGATYIAWRLAENGDRSLLPLSLAAAVKMLGCADPSHFDFNGAANLLFGYGNDEHLALYLRALRGAKASDLPRYWALWHAALIQQNPRVLQAAAVLIDDERPAKEQSSYYGMRYCDIAVSRLQEVTAHQFGFVPGRQSLEERNLAVKRARAWLLANKP